MLILHLAATACCVLPGVALHEAIAQVDQEAPVQQPHMGHARGKQHT